MTTAQKQVSRIETGIQGLDPLIEGGLIRGDVHLLVGGPGTGKSILAANFVFNAVTGHGEKAIYATFEESTEYFKRNIKRVGIDLHPAEQAKTLRIIDLEALRGKELESNISLLISAVKETGSTILVIDSLTALLYACETRFELRTFMKTMYKSLKELGTTSLMTVSLPDGTTLGTEGFLVDSVMFLENWMDQSQFKTRFVVLKMRGTNHSKKYHSVILSPKLSISKF